MGKMERVKMMICKVMRRNNIRQKKKVAVHWEV